jgi:hypothetical protein
VIKRDGMEKDNWKPCVFCGLKWQISSLELELCPECFDSLKSNPGLDYDVVKLEMILRHSEMDEKVREAIRIIWDQVKTTYRLGKGS